MIPFARTSALLIAAGLVLAATPAAAAAVAEPAAPALSGAVQRQGLDEPAVVFEAPQPFPSPSVQSAAVPAQQPAESKQLVLGSTQAFAGSGEGPSRPIRPGEEFVVNFGVRNDGSETESGRGEYVLTVTVPPEVTFISLESVNASCSGNVCRGTVEPERGFETDARPLISFRGRLSASFRGTTSNVRGGLQEDANPDPAKRTATTVVEVQASASTAAPGPPTSGGTGGAQTLPVTGGTASFSGLAAILFLAVGAMAHATGRRRPWR